MDLRMLSQEPKPVESAVSLAVYWAIQLAVDSAIQWAVRSAVRSAVYSEVGSAVYLVLDNVLEVSYNIHNKKENK